MGWTLGWEKPLASGVGAEEDGFDQLSGDAGFDGLGDEGAGSAASVGADGAVFVELEVLADGGRERFPTKDEGVLANGV